MMKVYDTLRGDCYLRDAGVQTVTIFMELFTLLETLADSLKDKLVVAAPFLNVLFEITAGLSHQIFCFLISIRFGY